MADMAFIWLMALCNWLNAGKPSAKAILSAKVIESPMNNVRSDGWDG